MPAVGLDYFDGIESNYDAIAEHSPLARGDARHIFRTVEEFIEMIGTTFILVAFLQHWRHSQLVAPLQPPGRDSHWPCGSSRVSPVVTDMAAVGNRPSAFVPAAPVTWILPLNSSSNDTVNQLRLAPCD